MQVINSGPRLRVCTFDGDLVIRLRPGEGAEVEDAKHVDVRDLETVEHHEPERHHSLYRTMVQETPGYRVDDYDSGDAR